MDHPIVRCVAAVRREIEEETAFDDKEHMRALAAYLRRHGYDMSDLCTDWLAASVLREIDQLKAYCDLTGSLLAELRAARLDAEAAMMGLPCPHSVAGRHDIRSTDYRPRDFLNNIKK